MDRSIAATTIAACTSPKTDCASSQALWGLLNYTNFANNGDWHNGRMLASGPRVNPWLQEATDRKLEAGDLVAFDTDMAGPFGYFADISRTLFC